MEDVKVIEDFLKPRNVGYGSGYGYSYGYGYGDGDGSGYGYSYGYGDGSGSGYGYGYGDGSGSGSGDGDGSGSGSGSGYGDGDGSGYGYSYGYGYGDGDGSGYGYSYGYGYGYGSCFVSINGERIWYIDDVPTIIDHVRGDYAKAIIVCDDFTMNDCYIARVDNYFAHGKTLRKAFEDAEGKAMDDMPLEERLAKFKATFPSIRDRATCATFYKWHHILTGSCTMGRNEFVKSHSLDMEKEYTVEYFLDIVKYSYGRDAIRQLREMYES